jgi:hypothetical protein
VEAKKSVLIVTDGSELLQKTAKALSGALNSYRVVLRKANDFEGTDLLPACAFFLGCREPRPSGFSYLGEMLAHINLADRRCGVFSADPKALDYLSALVRDCEAVLGEPLLLGDGAPPDGKVLKKWTEGVLG